MQPRQDDAPPTEREYRSSQLETQLRSSTLAYPTIGAVVAWAFHDGGYLPGLVLAAWCFVAFVCTLLAFRWLRAGAFERATRVTVGLSLGLALVFLVFCAPEVRVVGCLGLFITQTFAVFMEDERGSVPWIAASVGVWVAACVSWFVVGPRTLDFGRATIPTTVIIPIGVLVSTGMMGRGATAHLRRALHFSESLRRELETRVEERTVALRGAVTELERVNADLQSANAELERLNAELARSNGELEQFAYVASHDLQEPLRKVQAFGDRLRSRYSDALDDTGRDYLQRMQNAAGRMSALINDLLAFSRVTSKAQPFVRVELDAVLREVTADLETALQDADARVEVEALPAVEADPLQMRQLFQNLLSNAIKFRREGVAPVVKVSASSTEDVVAVRVADNGVGFEERYAERIFKLFERLHGRDRYPGTGVGLAICRKIAERHGGAIAARGTPGEGATFTVSLPSRQARRPTSERPDEPAARSNA